MSLDFRPTTSPFLSGKRDAILESRRSESRAYASSPPASASSGWSINSTRPLGATPSISASRATLHGRSHTEARPFTAPVPVASNYPSALSVHGNPPKPRASFDIISNHTTSHKPKVSASLPSSEFILNRSSIVDQRINMVNWREPKRIEDPSPVASRRAALGKLYIKERSHSLPVDIIAWSPKSSGSLAAGKRAAAVAAGHSALMVTGNAIAPASAPANRNVRTERPF